MILASHHTQSRKNPKNSIGSYVKNGYIDSYMVEITPQELKTRLDKGGEFVLIDVREQDEFDICHLDNAVLVPLSQFQQQIEDLKSYTNKEVVCYCHHGTRSLQAALWMLKNGFNNVKSLKGGIDLWAREIEPEMERY